jgi:hypothetical protein
MCIPATVVVYDENNESAKDEKQPRLMEYMTLHLSMITSFGEKTSW